MQTSLRKFFLRPAARKVGKERHDHIGSGLVYLKVPSSYRIHLPRSILHQVGYRLAALSLVFAACLCAGEHVVLTSGVRLAAEGHKRVGSRIRLLQKEGSFIEIPASVIVRFEKLDKEFQLSNAKGVAGRTITDSPKHISKLISDLADKHQLLRALAACNAGPRNVDRYDGLPLYSETHLFVSRVMRRFMALSESTSIR